MRAFVIVWLAQLFVTSLLYDGGAPLRIYVGATIILVVATIFLLRGSRLAWIFFALGIGGAVYFALSRAAWGSAIFHGVLFLALIAPETRQYIWRQQARG